MAARTQHASACSSSLQPCTALLLSCICCLPTNVCRLPLAPRQDAAAVTTTAAKAGYFEARFFHKVRLITAADNV